GKAVESDGGQNSLLPPGATVNNGQGMNHRTARLQKRIRTHALMACRAAAATGFLGGALPGQGTKEAPRAGATAQISVAVNELIIPVVVRDNSGRAVGGLTKDQFQVFDRGKLRSIARFHSESRSSEGLASDVGQSELARPSDANPQARAVRRFIVILFDNRHMEEAEV